MEVKTANLWGVSSKQNSHFLSPAEGLGAARGADVEVAALPGRVRRVLASQRDGGGLHHLRAGAPQLGPQGQDYGYGQRPWMERPG